MLVAESFFPAVDGTTTTVKAVVDRLVETGHTVLVVAPAPGLTSYRGCRVARIQQRDRVGTQVREVLEAFGPDLVHVTSPGTVGRKALKHASRLGVPTLTVQQTPVSALAADQWCAKVRDRSDAGARDRHLDARPGSPTWVSPPGSGDRASTRPPSAPSSGTPGCTAPGRAAVRAAARGWSSGSWAACTGGTACGCSRTSAWCPASARSIVGDGPQRGWLAARMPEAKFTGPLGSGDLTRALAAMDVLVHPGTQETCCHALREAAASGVPVVAPRAGWRPGRRPLPRDRAAVRPDRHPRPRPGGRGGRRGTGTAPCWAPRPRGGRPAGLAGGRRRAGGRTTRRWSPGARAHRGPPEHPDVSHTPRGQAGRRGGVA